NLRHLELEEKPMHEESHKSSSLWAQVFAKCKPVKLHPKALMFHEPPTKDENSIPGTNLQEPLLIKA
ncbi:hypothetical protein P7K49_015355, partial [Saguinus oedipus]